MAFTIKYNLTDGSSHCGRLLDTVTTESIGKGEVRNDRVGTNYPILIEGVVFVVTRPG